MLGGHAHPEVTLHTPSLAAYVGCLDRMDLAGIGDLMLASADCLKAAGADFLICPDNTVHQAIPALKRPFPLPFLHVADIVADVAVAAGYQRLGLTGTRWLVKSSVYPDALGSRGLACILPPSEACAEIDRIIMNELVAGIFSGKAVRAFQHVFTDMKDEGCDAVILGCTEIPLIMNDDNSPLPTLDSTRLLARAALNHAIEGSAR